jgi:hypothetical protein
MGCNGTTRRFDCAAPWADHGDDVKCTCVEKGVDTRCVGEARKALRDRAEVGSLHRLNAMERTIC